MEAENNEEILLGELKDHNDPEREVEIAKLAQQATEPVKKETPPGQNPLAKVDSIDDLTPKNIFTGRLSAEEQLRRVEEQVKQREENERRFREKEQSLLKAAPAPKQFIDETKAPTPSLKASSYAKEGNKAKQIMEQRLRVLGKTPVYGAALIDEFRHAVKTYATECRNAQVAESDYYVFLDKLLSECVGTARKGGMTLDTSNIMLPTLRSPFSDPSARDLKAQIKQDTMWASVKWHKESFKSQFNWRLEKSFNEVVFVNELTVKRLIENSNALRVFFLNFADYKEQDLKQKALQLTNECITKQWQTLFQTKPQNPVFSEEMSSYLQMVERDLNVKMDQATYDSFSIYPKKHLQPQFAESSHSFANPSYSSNSPYLTGSSNPHTKLWKSIQSSISLKYRPCPHENAYETRKKQECTLKNNLPAKMSNNEEYLTAEEFVDIHYAIYLKNVQIAEEYPGANDQMIKMGKGAARNTLLEKMKNHHDRERALEVVTARFERENKKSIEELLKKDNKIEKLKKELTEPNNSANQGNRPAIDSPPNNQYLTDNDTSEPVLTLLPLFDIDENGKTFFDKDVLNNLCDQIGDRPLAVISTAGKFRLGKTFWNNVMLKGLQNGKAQFAPDDFIGGKGRIQFKGGFVRHTKGIMVWPKVFTRHDKDGKELAVVLMDTQGTFDTTSNLADSSIIFAISLLMSSVKIFNTRGQVDAQDLDALNTFIAFSQRSDEKAGQHFLIMVRDSIRKGLDMEYLEGMKNTAKTSRDLVKLLDGVFEAFDRVECFMVPRPSVDVIEASGEIMAKDCGGDFLGNLCDCANYVLENLAPKIVMGSPLTGKTLREYVENLVLYIQANTHRAICSAFAATSQLYFEKARNAGNETFANLHDLLIREYGHRPIKPAEYEVKLHEILTQAIQVYQSNPLFGSAEERNKNFADFKKTLEDRCQERLSSNRDRYRDVHLADAVNSAFAEYEKGMKPDTVQRLLKAQKAGAVKENHERSFPAAMKLFDKAVEDFVDEPELVDYKRILLCDMIQLRYDDLLHDNTIHELHNKVELLFNDILEEHWKILKQHVETTTSLEKIDESIENCQHLLNTKYGLKKREFVLEAEAVLPNVSLQTVEQMLDNYRDSLSVHFKKCENSFANEVRHQINVKALEGKIENLHEKQAEEKKYLEELQEATNTQITDLNEKLREEEEKRREAEEGGENIQVVMKMMEAMNQNAEKQIERMHEERLQQIQAENARREAEAQREMEMRKEMTKDRREFEERLHEQENQRRADEQANREAMQRQIEQMHQQQRDFMNRPPPRGKSSCSIM